MVEDTGLFSEGSRKHESGTCTPCLFSMHSVCTKGRDCQYCHLKHESKKARPSKRVREKLREATVKDLSAVPGCEESIPLTAGPVNPGSANTGRLIDVPRVPGPLNPGLVI